MSTSPGPAPPPAEPAKDGEPSEQELVDYLVTATAEQDVLFVVYWLRRLKERGRLWRTEERCSAIEAKHSWRNLSALEALTSHSRTTLREFILFLFLFNLETVSFKGKIVLNVEVEQDWAKKVVGKWEYKWRGASLRALDLLRMTDDDEAANWIDANLPLPPNPHLLTGYNPLPPPPLQAVKAEPSPAPPSLSPPATASVPKDVPPPPASEPLPSSLPPKSPSPPSPSLPPSASLPSVSVSPTPPQLANSDTPSRLPPLRKSPSKLQPGRIPLPSSAGLGADHSIRLHLFNLPSSTNKNDLRNVLASIQVSCLAIDLVRENNNEFSHAYVTVPDRASWERADRLLPTTTVRGRMPLVERLHPSRKERGIPSHPTVYIDGLLPRTSRFEVGDIMRKTRCGAYDAEVTMDGRQGRARASSPDTAGRMVRLLDGLEVGRESRIKASWVGEDGGRHGVGEEKVEEKEKEKEEEGAPLRASTSRLNDPPPSSHSPLPVYNSHLRPRSPSPSASPSRRRSIYPSPEPSPAPPQKRPRLTPPPPSSPMPSTSLSASYNHPPPPQPPVSLRNAGLETLKRRTSDPHPSLPGRPRPRSPSPPRRTSSFPLRDTEDRWAPPPPRRPSPPPPSSRRPRAHDRPSRSAALSASYNHPPDHFDREGDRRRDDDRSAPPERRRSDPRPRQRSPSPFFPPHDSLLPNLGRSLMERLERTPPPARPLEEWRGGEKGGRARGERGRGGRR